MKIAILYICAGKYAVFWKDFYTSCEERFIAEAEKEYFVFTNADGIEHEAVNPKIHRLYQKNLGWPGNTLRRYEIFLGIREKLESFDYVFYLNANLLFLQPIGAEEILPGEGEELVACLHPGFFDEERSRFTYDTNPESRAFIPEDQGLYYFAGGINGGKTRPFIAAMEQMARNIAEDLKHKIIAVWHDESHWNRYLVGRTDIKILTPSYLYPEGWDLPFEIKILVRDKGKFGGHSSIRGCKRTLKSRLKNALSRIVPSD